MEEARKIASMANDQSKKAKERSSKVHRENREPTLRDICYLLNAELEPQLQKYNGWVVIEGDIVKDDVGSYAVFTVLSSSASPVTAAKVIMDVLARVPGCAGQAADAVSACTHVKNGGRFNIVETSQDRESRRLDTSTTTQVAEILVQHRRPSH